MTQALSDSDESTWRMSFAAARHRLRELEKERASITDAMEALVWRFSSTLTHPPVRPALQRVALGHLYVRWRLSGRNGEQPYLDMTGEAGAILLQRLSADMQLLLLQYVRDALNLNLAHSIRQSEWIRLRQYVADYESLNSIRGQ